MFQTRKRFNLKNWIKTNKNKTYEDFKLFLSSRDVVPPPEDLFSSILLSVKNSIPVQEEVVQEEVVQEEVLQEEVLQEEVVENKSSRRSRNKRKKQSISKDEKESSQ